MVKDRIVVFNRLTDHTIADCSIFEELLENHYQKFVYFYNIIENNDIIEYTVSQRVVDWMYTSH